MNRRRLLAVTILVAALAATSCARHVVAERALADSLGDRDWTVEREPVAVPPAPQGSSDVVERLRAIEALHADGLLDDAEYEEKRREILEEL
jgi:hypothetical protein